jgi:glycerol kinase
MKEYIISIDQGTTATKVVLHSLNGELKAISTHPIKQIYPKDGWVEHDPFNILESIKKGIRDVINKSNIVSKQILAIGIDNQGETIIAFEKNTGEPLYNAIVWQDRRTSSFCNQLKEKIEEKVITDKTGLFLDPYFSAPKMNWLINNVGKVRSSLNKRNAIIATSDVWLLFMLTGKKSFLTDVTTASRTLLFNINTLQWDNDLLALFDIPKYTMPEVVPSSYQFGFTDPGICEGIAAPINASVVDQQASLLGHTCFHKGEAKITYGTGGFLLLNIGGKRIKLNDKISTTLTAQYDKNVNYAIDGGVYCVASCINWLINELRIVSSPKEIDEMKFDAGEACNTYFVPSMAGISAPYWKSDVNGAFFGLSLNTKGEDLVRAVHEGIAYRFLEIVDIIKKNGFKEITSISVDGGVSRNNFLIQYQADLLGTKIRRPAARETTSLGCFYLSGLKSGVWKDLDSLKDKTVIEKVFSPEKDNSRKIKNYKKWQIAVESVLNWHEGIS